MANFIKKLLGCNDAASTGADAQPMAPGEGEPALLDNTAKCSDGSSPADPLCTEVQQVPLPTEPVSVPLVVTREDIDSLQSSWSNALADLQAQMEKLLTEFNGKLKYDSKKQEQIDQLYKENVDFREGLVEQFKRKLALTVIEQIDDAEKQIAYFEKADHSEENFCKIFDSFKDISLGFRDMLLERFDIESWKSAPETPFDPRRQRTLRTTPTGEKEKAKTIKNSIRFGYQTADGIILRPEMVEVYVFDKSQVSSKPAAPEPATPEPATPEPATPEPATPEPAASAPVDVPADTETAPEPVSTETNKE